MNVLIVSPTLNIPLAPDHGLSVDLEYGSALPLDPELECPRNSLIIVRSEHRDIVLIMRDGNGSLIVNGHKVYGFCSVHANAVVRVHVGNHVQSFAVIFDDAVVDIPAGSACDICGKNLQELGKGHCKRKLCVDCIETFAAKCPDCGKHLLASDASHDSQKMMQEFFIEE